MSHIYAAPVLGNAWLFVDFFFVLSGFVISHAYFESLTRQGTIVSFVIKRFGRVWPLHVAMLGFLVGFEVLEAITTRALHMAALPSDILQNPRIAFSSILANIALVQDIGLEHFFAGIYPWNGPSWSISVEFYTYIIFALICIFGKNYSNFLLAITVICSLGALLLITLYGDSLDIYQLIQCVYGFILGHFVWRFASAHPLSPKYATSAEIMTVVVAVFYMAIANPGPIRLFSPFIFGFAVWIFSAGHGLLSRILRLPPFLKIGALSYSIYMIHFSILRVALALAKETDRLTHSHIVIEGYMPYAGTVQFFNFGNLWFGDAFEIGFIAIVIFTSTLTFRYIEIPSKQYFYRKAKSLQRHTNC